MQVPSLVAHETAQANDTDEIADNKRSASVIVQLSEPLGQEAVGLAGLVRSLLLGEIGLSTELLLLTVEAVGLRLGLDFLLGEVRRDSADRRSVDID